MAFTLLHSEVAPSPKNHPPSPPRADAFRHPLSFIFTPSSAGPPPLPETMPRFKVLSTSSVLIRFSPTGVRFRIFSFIASGSYMEPFPSDDNHAVKEFLLPCRSPNPPAKLDYRIIRRPCSYLSQSFRETPELFFSVEIDVAIRHPSRRPDHSASLGFLLIPPPKPPLNPF